VAGAFPNRSRRKESVATFVENRNSYHSPVITARKYFAHNTGSQKIMIVQVSLNIKDFHVIGQHKLDEPLQHGNQHLKTGGTFMKVDRYIPSMPESVLGLALHRAWIS